MKPLLQETKQRQQTVRASLLLIQNQQHLQQHMRASQPQTKQLLLVQKMMKQPLLSKQRHLAITKQLRAMKNLQVQQKEKRL